MTDRFHKRLWNNAVTYVSTTPPAPRLKVVDGLRECHCCGLFQAIPKVPPGFVAYCQRCDAQLARRRRTSPVATPAAFFLTSAALYLALLITQLLTINVRGRVNTVSLMTGPLELAREGFGEVGYLVGLTTLVMPGIVIALMGAILYAISRPQMPEWTPRLMTWYQRLREWSMVEVYILGVFVAYTKLIDLALVDLQAGVFLIAALMLSMAATDSALDVEKVWHNRDISDSVEDHRGYRLKVEHVSVDEEGMPSTSHLLSCHACGLVMAFDEKIPIEEDMGDCPRCQQIIHKRKSRSLGNALALLVCGLICYIPANLFPIMTFTKLGKDNTATIVRGAIELWQADLIPLALLVLFASVFVPVLKILSLFAMIYTTWRRKNRGLRRLTKLYRLIDIIGRWSMIDVFMISILVAVVHFNFVANVRADPGIVFFTIVVVVTIFAVHCFDPRIMWDAAGENGLIGVPDQASPQSCMRKKRPFWSSLPFRDMERERA